VSSVLGVGTHAARTLLIHHRWSEEALFACYAERGLEDTLRAAGVTSRVEADAAPAGGTAAGAWRVARAVATPACAAGCGREGTHGSSPNSGRGR
jgi:hypothetical protein